jgi:hypothetical protein
MSVYAWFVFLKTDCTERTKLLSMYKDNLMNIYSQSSIVYYGPILLTLGNGFSISFLVSVITKNKFVMSKCPFVLPNNH